ncbi:MAG: TonB family protein [Flavobacteriales bacterium]|nr:TonB family protein [Flavobacteriales bacterium]
MMQGINPKYNRTGKIVATVVVLLILLMSFMVNIDPPMKMPEVPKEEIVAVLDFTPPTNAGGGASGGSETPAETKQEDAAPDKHTTPKDPEPEQTTQKEESPVTTKPTTNSNPNNGNGSGQDPAISGNPFGGSGGGNDGGNGNGNGDNGVGVGDGPGIGGGVGDGSGRLVLEEPHISNPVQDQGRVMLELIIDRNGNVISAKVLKTHSMTTTTNPAHFDAAQKAAKDWKFNKDPNGPEKQKVYKSINFTLD